MARLFASLEEDLVQDLDNVESSVATDGPEDNESDLTDPVAETSLEQYKDIKSAVEEALEVQEEVQDQINKNEEVLEENPESVSEEVIAESQECLIASLSKLGLSKDSLVKYRISGESFKSNSEKLVALNKKLKLANETITRSLRSAIMQSYAISDRKFGISQEYNAMDWPQFFLRSINSVWRKFTNKSTTKVTNPGSLVYFLTGNWTAVGEFATLALKMFDIATTYMALPGIAAAGGAAAAATSSTGITAGFIVGELGSYIHDTVKGRNGQTIAGGVVSKIKELGRLKANVYKELIMGYKSIKSEDYNRLAEEFVVYKAYVRKFKQLFCKPCEEQPMGLNDIHQMKLFKPDKAQAEMAKAIAHLKTVDPKLAKLADELAAFIGKEILEFIIKNTVRDV